MKNILIGLFCLCGFTALAQEDFSAEEREGHLVLSRDSLEEEVGLIPEAIDADVDSLLHSWHVRYFSKTEEYCHDDEENVYFPDSIYIERLERLPRVITLPYNNIVRDCIDLYAERRRDLVRYMLGMADFYFPIIEQRTEISRRGRERAQPRRPLESRRRGPLAIHAPDGQELRPRDQQPYR